VLGTPRYMAPEQARGQTDLDERVDGYALGVILYEMLTGRVPFLGRTSLEIVQKHLHDTPETPRSLRADIPAEVEQVVMRALEKDRDRRYRSVRELCGELPAADAYPGGERAWPVPDAPGRSSRPAAGPGTRSGARTRAERPPPRVARARGTVLVVVLGLSLAVGLALWPDRPPPQQAHPGPRRDQPARVVEERVVQVPTPPVPPVVLEIRATPASARILVGDELRGRGRARIEAPRSELPIPVRVEADGFSPAELLLVPREDTVREVRLERVRRGGVAPPPTPPTPPTPPRPPGTDDLMGSPYGTPSPPPRR